MFEYVRSITINQEIRKSVMHAFLFLLMNFHILDTRVRYFSTLYNTVICPCVKRVFYVNTFK
jgi:hypothetical protein